MNMNKMHNCDNPYINFDTEKCKKIHHRYKQSCDKMGKLISICENTSNISKMFYDDLNEEIMKLQQAKNYAAKCTELRTKHMNTCIKEECRNDYGHLEAISRADKLTNICRNRIRAINDRFQELNAKNTKTSQNLFNLLSDMI